MRRLITILLGAAAATAAVVFLFAPSGVRPDKLSEFIGAQWRPVSLAWLSTYSFVVLILNSGFLFVTRRASWIRHYCISLAATQYLTSVLMILLIGVAFPISSKNVVYANISIESLPSLLAGAALILAAILGWILVFAQPALQQERTMEDEQEVLTSLPPNTSVAPAELAELIEGHQRPVLEAVREIARGMSHFIATIRNDLAPLKTLEGSDRSTVLHSWSAAQTALEGGVAELRNVLAQVDASVDRAAEVARSLSLQEETGAVPPRNPAISPEMRSQLNELQDLLQQIPPQSQRD